MLERRTRMTPQRTAVLEVVREAHDHPTAAQIYERVKQRMPRLSYGTVYNALAALADQGEVLELSFGDSASRYDGRNDRHDHAVCLGCGRMEDVESRLPESVVVAASQQSGFRLVRHHTEFFGYCADCTRAGR